MKFYIKYYGKDIHKINALGSHLITLINLAYKRFRNFKKNKKKRLVKKKKKIFF